MITKIRAAQRAARSGAHTCIANGREPDGVIRLARGENLGTLLYATSTPSRPASNGSPTTCSWPASSSSTPVP